MIMMMISTPPVPGAAGPDGEDPQPGAAAADHPRPAQQRGRGGEGRGEATNYSGIMPSNICMVDI